MARAGGPGRVAFDGSRALEHLRAQCEAGPRVPGTRPHEVTRAYLKQELGRWADEVKEQRFRVRLGAGQVELTNVIALFRPAGDKATARPAGEKGRGEPWVMICAHWDSRPTADLEHDATARAQATPGANDGASGTAVILELARVLSLRRPPQGVMLVLFDGEDYGPGTDRMFLGSRHFAQEYRGPKLEWAALLDMVGDRELRLPVEGYSRRLAPAVVARIWQAAERVGSRAFVPQEGGWIMDDHLPLLKIGIPCINIIDFEYPYWHTLADTPDKCSAESLAAVGEVLVEAVMNR